jgi:hypothetical protein
MSREIPFTDWVYDIETYLDIFSAAIVHVRSGTRFIFEVSDRVNQSSEFVEHVRWIGSLGHRMFGFNNIHFDWPVCNHLLDVHSRHGSFEAVHAYEKAQAIISAPNEDRFAHTVWPSDMIVTQGDLFKIHHFDNPARSTSLKKLEINMRSDRVVDLPSSPHDLTNDEEKDRLISYMCHDVNQTIQFYIFSLDQMLIRDELAEKYPQIGDVLNFNDTKIGKKFFEMELESSGTPCYSRATGRREPIQTRRENIYVSEILSNRLSFKSEAFQSIHKWFGGLSIKPWQTKGFLKDVNVSVDGFQYDFGSGGIHGSVSKTAVHEDDEWEVWDWDVASYYPNLAIVNGFYPHHLSQRFCEIYKSLYDTRQTYPKKSVENAIYKLALNGVYGDSNNEYSPFYDPQYTMSITINGQLFLCMLAEMLTFENDDVEMIQINTDGLTIRVRKKAVPFMHDVCRRWCELTGLSLESAKYKSMFVRDVNNYLAVKPDGSCKRIGAYSYITPIEDPGTRELPWHKDHSKRIVPMAAEAAMVRGEKIEDYIMRSRDVHAFQAMIKVRRSDQLMAGESKVQSTSRYYVSTDGVNLYKIMPPLAGKADVRKNSVEAGWSVTLTNDISAFSWENVNWYHYVHETRKLIV